LSAPPRTDKFENYSCEQLLKFINERKPDVLKKIDHSNKRRLIRAAQLIDSGNKLHNKNEPLYNPIFIEIVIDRNLMNENINNNVNKMLKNG
jgi:tRNA A37 N6-isopentenylltransferase MiaA